MEDKVLISTCWFIHQQRHSFCWLSRTFMSGGIRCMFTIKRLKNIKSSYLTLSDHCKALKKFYIDQGIHAQKYTGHHGKGKNGGWSWAGKVRYNLIYDNVLKDCTPEKSSAFNNCFIMYYQKMKWTIATVTTGKEEDKQPPFKMCFLGHRIDPKLMAKV